MRRLHLACSLGDKSALKKIIDVYPLQVLETKDVLGRTPLILCVMHNHIECATLLLKAGVHVDSGDNAGQTPLHIAMNKGFHRCVKRLLSYGASWHQRDFLGVTSLHLAAVNCNVKCLSMILKVLKPGEIDTEDSTKKTALHWSSAYSNVTHLKLLLSQGANICIPDEDGKIPLHWAAMNPGPKALECVKVLLEKEKNLTNWQDYGGRSALHVAVATGSAEVVHFLASRKDCNIDILDNSFCTPLHWAARRGFSEKVNTLLNKRASHTSTDDNGAMPLHYAAYNDHAKTVEVFLSRNYIHDEGDTLGSNAFMWAAARNADTTVKIMAASGAILTYCDRNGTTALHAAAIQGHVSTIELLLNLGVPVDIVDFRGMTPLLKACELGRTKAAKVLLDYGANINAKDVNNCSVLHWCALGGHAYLCQILLHRGALCNIADYFGMVPLHYASILNDYINCVSVLLESEANPNVADFEGKTPLHRAVLNDRPGVARLLCEYDADVNAMALLEDWVTPLDFAVLRKNNQIISLLKKYEGLTGHEIKEFAITKIQLWYRKLSKSKKKLYKSVNNEQRNFSVLNASSTKGVLDCSSSMSHDSENHISDGTVHSSLSKIPLAKWRFYGNAQITDFEDLYSGIKALHCYADEEKSNIKEYRAAAVIQRCWRIYSMKQRFYKVRNQIQVFFETEEKRMRAEKLWQLKLKEFYRFL